jgi:hypothetical protein
MEGLQSLSLGTLATIWGSFLGLVLIGIFGFMEITSADDDDGEDE